MMPSSAKAAARPAQWMLGLIVSMIVVTSSCGRSIERQSLTEARWTPVSIEIHQGLRQAVYDPRRDSIWILTAPADPRLPALEEKLVELTEYRITTRETIQHRSPLTSRTLGIGNAMAIDANGDLWMAWDQNLVRFRPSDGSFESWEIAPTVLADPEEGSTARMAVALAIDQSSAVWVTVDGAPSAYRFVVDETRWEVISLGDVVTTTEKRITVTSSHGIAVNGIAGGSSSAAPKLALLDSRDWKPRSGKVAARQIAPLNETAIAYTDDRDRVGAANSTDGRSIYSRAIGKVPPRALTTHGERIWVWVMEEGRVVVHRMDPRNDQMDRVTFPHREGFGRGSFSDYRGDAPATQFSIADPDIQEMIVDKRGVAWLVTSHAGVTSDRGGYEPLYRLMI
ncbi:MAG TPA: hypothetical protein VM841_06975 [Actinomycetota bacterium]|nr:hypothetical protein [Actinomycetota bacterium]